MRKIIRWAIIVACSLGVGIGLAILEGKYEVIDFAVGLTGVMFYVVVVLVGLSWVLLENDEEDESQEESQLTKREE